MQPDSLHLCLCCGVWWCGHCCVVVCDRVRMSVLCWCLRLHSHSHSHSLTFSHLHMDRPWHCAGRGGPLTVGQHGTCWKGRTSYCWSIGGVRRKLEGRGRRMRRGSVNKKTPLGHGKPTCASRPTMLFTFPKLWMRLDSHAVLSTAAAQSSSGRVDKPGSNSEPVAKKKGSSPLD